MFKVQYKSAPNQQWQTKSSGCSEQSASSVYAQLKKQYQFVRILDKDGKTVLC